MFGFMKKFGDKDKDKDKDEKEKKVKELKKIDKKAERPLSEEELKRLEESKASFSKRTESKKSVPRSGSKDSISSGDRQTSPVSETGTITSAAKLDIAKTVKVPPPLKPKPKKGILKDKSSYGPEVPNHGVRGNLDDTITLEANTLANEFLPGRLVDGKPEGTSSSPGTPGMKKPVKPGSHASPGARNHSNNAGNNVSNTSTVFVPLLPSSDEKTYIVELKLPELATPQCAKPREIALNRLPSGDFGFTLRKGTVLVHNSESNTEKRSVVFAEPGPKNLYTGLLPGDRLLEVNGKDVENASREDIIELIKSSGNVVKLKVQPVPELSELSLRSGLTNDSDAADGESGVLKTTGGQRNKSRHIASEPAGQSDGTLGEAVWLVHKGGFAAAHLVKSDSNVEGKCKIRVDQSGDVLEVDEEDVEKVNPSQFDRVEDIALLRNLNESSMLHTLRQRYGSNLVHTYCGSSMIVINPQHPLSIYSEKVIQMFRGCRSDDMPPHVYAVAQTAYKSMQGSRRDQSLIFLGRSGSGKTNCARHALHYLTSTTSSATSVVTVEKLNAVFTVLDAFCNSRTVMNTSATRCTQIISLDFDSTWQIASMSIQVFLIEKTRIAQRPEGEPTFHVFYHLLAGIEADLRKELQLDNLTDPNIFMTPLQRTEDRQKSQQAWARICHSLSLIGVQPNEAKAIYSLLAVIYHLGVAGVAKSSSGRYQFARPLAAQRAAAILGSSAEELGAAIFNPTGQKSNNLRVPTAEKGTQSLTDSITGLDALEGFVTGLYAEACGAIVALVNRSLSSNCRTVASMHIVDLPGLQNPLSVGKAGGATFRDLCDNYAHECMQLLFHDTVLTAHQSLYQQENIECDFELVTTSPAAMVMLMDRSAQQLLSRNTSGDNRDADQKGLLWLLDEDSSAADCTEASFMERLFAHHGQSGRQRNALLVQGKTDDTFVLNHMQGTCPVEYTVKGWLKACRENPAIRNATTFLQELPRNEISQLIVDTRGSAQITVGGSVVGLEGAAALRRTSNVRRTFTTSVANVKKKSVCLQVKYQMESIVDTLRRTNMHFVHCLLPQTTAGLSDLRGSSPGKTDTDDYMLNVPFVRLQVRGAELLDAVRLHRHGFPEHMPFSSFIQRYEVLLPVDQRITSLIVDEKQLVEKILVHLELEKSLYRLGLSQVFLRSGVLAQLEDMRDETVSDRIVQLQAICRGYLGRKKLERMHVQHTAVRCLQRNVRKLLLIRNWPWWKLYTRVQPLLNVQRSEDQIKNQQAELDALKAKVERLEKERNEYKQTADVLEMRLSEINGDLLEEHNTSTNAMDLLDKEMTERQHLDKELRELQVKHDSLQQKFHKAEMELMEARLIATEIEEAEDNEDEVSLYKDRFIRLKKEMQLNTKKLQQDHQEELEQYESHARALEKKLQEALDAEEEQHRQVVNIKKKSQRLTQDTQDLRLQLEEQITRNSDLEKKQRRFDSELAKVIALQQDEKTARERLQRERDELATDKYSLELKLKNVLAEEETNIDRIARLQRELDDLGSIGSKGDVEIVQLKKLKNELERKLQDLEEELDEQAGTLQLLEQAKLRLEMEKEKMRQQQAKELEEKEIEMEEFRASAQKKVKAAEKQLEDEYEEKQILIREKKELERKLAALSELKPTRNKDVEKRLMRDLRQTKGLLRDAQIAIDRLKESAGGKATIKQLRHQLEDAEYATAAAVKARKGVELELQEVQHQMDALSKSKQDLEDKCSQLSRDKNDLQQKVEDDEEEMAEIMKKYKVVVQQQSSDALRLSEQSRQIEQLQHDNQQLKDEVSQLQSRLEYLNRSTSDKEVVTRLEIKIRDLETKLEFEQTAKSKAESQLQRSKDQLERLNEQREFEVSKESEGQETAKRLQKQLRDLQEKYNELEKKEAETVHSKASLEKQVEALESEYEQSQSDLKLAFRRITDLQNVIEDQIGGSDEEISDSDADVDEEDEIATSDDDN